ncbi:unnamed protein product [Gongylonema pulchrum]|uniref:FAT domain-containing protein n=1 Tax=Gongylonema pulchrum TaxID=637853 RepID=A0A183CZV9_9BILA|nr:unnamed protein product [Gongylonema pulchrum]
MHCITLPSGEEMFWNVVNAQFTDQRWEERFSAANAAPISSNKVIQTSLSCCIAHLIASVDDPNPAVAQRALLSIKHMPSASLKLMCLCLESQFDSSILDRALIISRIQQLTSILPDEEILTWEFFIQRFEGLALESQLRSSNGDSTFVHDLMHSDPLSDLYQRKIARARQAIENSATARSIVRTLQSGSMRHQLSNATYRPNWEAVAELERGDAKRKSKAAISAREKIRRVVTVVRVVSVWKQFSKRLQSLTSMVSALARSAATQSYCMYSIRSTLVPSVCLFQHNPCISKALLPYVARSFFPVITKRPTCYDQCSIAHMVIFFRHSLVFVKPFGHLLPFGLLPDSTIFSLTFAVMLSVSSSKIMNEIAAKRDICEFHFFASAVEQ